MLKTGAPPGYSVSFSRHGSRWGWKRRWPKDDGLPNERSGFARRKDAIADAREAKKAELAKEAASKSGDG